MSTGIKIEFFGKVEGGILYVFNKETLARRLKETPDCQIKGLISKQYSRNSKNQRGYYWEVIVRYYQRGILEAWGEEKTLQGCHEDLKASCNYSEHYDEKSGRHLRMIRSSEGNTVEREDYHERCRKLIYTFFNLVVPLPNEDLTVPEEIL